MYIFSLSIWVDIFTLFFNRQFCIDKKHNIKDVKIFANKNRQILKIIITIILKLL